jgi:hypothetical protein
MNAGRDVERLIANWLVEESPGRAPDRVLDAAGMVVDRTQQRHPAAQWDLRISWRLPIMNPLLRLAGAAIIAVLAVGVAVFGLRPVSTGGPPPASPSASPAATTADASLRATAPATPRPTLSPLAYTQAHTSSVYHYSARFPATWTLAAGTDPNDPDAIYDIGVGKSDFYGDGVASGVMVTAGPRSTARSTLASWTPYITTFIEQKYGNYMDISTCTESTRPLIVDGEPANEVDFICRDQDWLWVTAVHAGRAYQIAWLDDGGFTAEYLRPFLDQFLAGFKFTK